MLFSFLKYLQKLLSFSVAAVLVGGCSQPAATAFQPTATLEPAQTLISTIVPSTIPPLASTEPTISPTQLPTPSNPTEEILPAFPTVTFTPESATPPKLTFNDIRIMQPGSLSKVISPITLEASAIPGDKGAVRIELIGEDGRPLFRQVNGYAVTTGQRVNFSQKIDFEIPGVSEAARLQISVSDSFGRVTSLASVSLILLTVGESEINFPGDQYAPYILTQPQKNQEVSGGKLQISGFARPVNTQAIRFDLIGRQGEIYGSRLLTSPATQAGGYAQISTDIPYSVSASTWVLLVVHQADTRIPGDATLASIPILLQP